MTLGFAPFWFVGCGGAERPPLGYVTGVVSMDGEPLGNVVVVMKPESGRAAMVQANENGEYDMEYIKGERGTKVGPTTVSFEWPLGYADPQGRGIPAKYSAAKSELKVDVQSGNNKFDFDLESDPKAKPGPVVE